MLILLLTKVLNPLNAKKDIIEIVKTTIRIPQKMHILYLNIQFLICYNNFFFPYISPHYILIYKKIGNPTFL